MMRKRWGDKWNKSGKSRVRSRRRLSVALRSLHVRRWRSLPDILLKDLQIPEWDIWFGLSLHTHAAGCLDLAVSIQYHSYEHAWSHDLSFLSQCGKHPD
ncbi:hypothetical protein BO86DRAFT_111050 [Aspergillus japonicus CBS 114.51]|uniref:Uncharacterized protein n=2 Tax=Aspergillus TaxID=5052 RepID=A0A2V5H0X4_ASPV1|nr:hypothetical protein BO86DRAFT_111050 [Aspergillus japonicus CBS 114.51]PYI15244.1 hypothetical protein BO99DRAFT_260253 [Aspergillus violaceofuscus CBS 115571]RAH86472.1 hypothetical protein BO86DRAFT_111050 [Aspergillus japonicus CBS 114.51]